MLAQLLLRNLGSFSFRSQLGWGGEQQAGLCGTWGQSLRNTSVAGIQSPPQADKPAGSQGLLWPALSVVPVRMSSQVQRAVPLEST